MYFLPFCDVLFSMSVLFHMALLNHSAVRGFGGLGFARCSRREARDGGHGEQRLFAFHMLDPFFPLSPRYMHSRVVESEFHSNTYSKGHTVDAARGSWPHY